VLALQSVFHVLPDGSLYRTAPDYTDASFTLHSWTSGSWQSAAEQRAIAAMGFRPLILRSVNQLRFSLFGEHDPSLVQGRQGQWFDVEGQTAVCGEDALSEQQVAAYIDSLDQFHNALAARGKKLILLFAPNKWRTYHDLIDWPCEAKRTNYEAFASQLRHRGYTVCDMIDLFQYDERQGVEFPLHAAQGAEWSVFGAALSMDYLRFAFAEEGIRLPQVRFESIEVSNVPLGLDRSLHDAMDLWLGPQDETLAYPKLGFVVQEKPVVAVIGDESYFNYFALDAHHGLFDDDSRFLYRNKSVVANDLEKAKPITPALRIAAIEQADVVLIVMTESSLSQFGFGVLSQYPNS
jgi:hypothetical protein